MKGVYKYLFSVDSNRKALRKNVTVRAGTAQEAVMLAGKEIQRRRKALNIRAGFSWELRLLKITATPERVKLTEMKNKPGCEENYFKDELWDRLRHQDIVETIERPEGVGFSRQPATKVTVEELFDLFEYRLRRQGSLK